MSLQVEGHQGEVMESDGRMEVLKNGPRRNGKFGRHESTVNLGDWLIPSGKLT